MPSHLLQGSFVLYTCNSVSLCQHDYNINTTSAGFVACVCEMFAHSMCYMGLLRASNLLASILQLPVSQQLGLWASKNFDVVRQMIYSCPTQGQLR